MKRIWDHKWRFLAYFTLIFTVLFTLLYALDLVPSALVAPSVVSSKSQVKPAIVGEIPVRITIPSVGVDTVVYNPESTSVTVLDSFLAKGAVRYPGSGLAGVGNMFIFAHSTGLRVVNNPAYKTFNNLNQLVAGDLIYVSSGSQTYTYAVEKVSLVNKNTALVDFTVKKNMLTLSTCNSFGQVDDRYVVEASLVE